jgi:hypothetical protein
MARGLDREGGVGLMDRYSRVMSSAEELRGWEKNVKEPCTCRDEYECKQLRGLVHDPTCCMATCPKQKGCRADG